MSLLRGNEGGSVGMLPLQEAQSNWGKVGRAEQSRGSGGRRKWSAAARPLCLPPKKQQSHCDKQFRKVEAEGNMRKKVNSASFLRATPISFLFSLSTKKQFEKSWRMR